MVSCDNDAVVVILNKCYSEDPHLAHSYILVIHFSSVVLDGIAILVINGILFSSDMV